LIAWMIIEMESDPDRKGLLVDRIRRSIIKILGIVHTCHDDSDHLWQLLLSFGCVLLMHPRSEDEPSTCFTIEGTICRFQYDVNTTKMILDDFKNLTLIKSSQSMQEVQRINSSNVNHVPVKSEPVGT
jgi:hypothetical protein